MRTPCWLVFGLLAASALAGEPGAQQPPPLTILTHQEPPFVYHDEEGKLTGYAVELVRGIQSETGDETPILLNPWARIYFRATSEPNVLLFSLVRNADRESTFHWITPITRNLHGLFADRDLHLEIQSLKDLEKLPAIGVQRGDFREQLLIEAGLTNLVSYTTWPQALGALLKGRVSALFFSAAGIDYYCKELQENCSNIVNIYQHEVVATYLALSRQGTSEELVRQWKQAAEDYKASEDFAKMAGDWVNRYRKELGFPLHLGDGALNFWVKPRAGTPAASIRSAHPD